MTTLVHSASDVLTSNEYADTIESEWSRLTESTHEIWIEESDSQYTN